MARVVLPLAVGPRMVNNCFMDANLHKISGKSEWQGEKVQTLCPRSQFQTLYRFGADEGSSEIGGEGEEHQQGEVDAVAEVVGEDAGECARDRDADSGEGKAVGVEHDGMVAP